MGHALEFEDAVIVRTASAVLVFISAAVSPDSTAARVRAIACCHASRRISTALPMCSDAAPASPVAISTLARLERAEASAERISADTSPALLPAVSLASSSQSSTAFRSAAPAPLTSFRLSSTHLRGARFEPRQLQSRGSCSAARLGRG